MKQDVLKYCILCILIFTTIPLTLVKGDLSVQDVDNAIAPKESNRASHLIKASTVIVDNTTTIDWIKRHQKPDGGYGRLDNSWSHISWTYPAVHALYLLDKMRSDNYAKPSNTLQTIAWLHTLEGKGPNHSFNDNNNRKGNSPASNTPHSDFEGVYSLLLLGSNLDDTKTEIDYLSSVSLTYSGTYESGDLLNALQVAWALDLVGAADRANQNNVAGFMSWLKSRQLSDGGWNRLDPNDVNEYDNVQNNKSWLTYTWYAVKLHEIFKETVDNSELILDWVASTQASNGGFALFPVDESRDGFSGITDVYYTWCALSICDYFNDFSLINRVKALEYLNSLQNYDGGFGDKLGWDSRLYATFWAIASIDILGGTITSKLRAKSPLNPIPEDGSILPYVWASQQDTNQNNGYYPSEAMLLGERYHITLLGRKDTKSAYLNDANEYATNYDLQIRAILTPEGYGTSFHVNGLMENSHRWYYFSKRSHRGPNTDNYYYNWTTWRHLLDTVHDSGGYGYFAGGSLDETYYVMDDSILNKRGYQAITGSDILSGDKVRMKPWLEKYIGRVPFIAEQDAHNDFFKEIKKINELRGIFLAPNGTWAGLVDAIMKNRIALVFMDSPRVIYGTNETVSFLRKHLDQVWNKKYDGQISVVPVTHGNYQLAIPNNDYEHPSWKPASGVHFDQNFRGLVIKIKSCAKSIDFISLDDSPNITNLAFVESPRKEIQSYYWINLKSPTNGTHTISVQYTHTNESQLWYNVTFNYNSVQGREEGKPPTVTVLSPNGGEVWAGVKTIQWTASDPDGDPLSYTLFYRNGNTDWTVIETGLSTTSYEWDTKLVPNGSDYIIKIIAADGNFSSEDVSNSTFSIANQIPQSPVPELPKPPPEPEPEPPKSPPEPEPEPEPPKSPQDEWNPPTITVLNPNGGEVWTGVKTIQWTASDPDGDPLSYMLFYRNGKTDWIEIETGLSTTSYEWDTKLVPNGSGYVIKIIAADGHFLREDVSDSTFSISNKNPVKSEKSLLERIHSLSIDQLILFLDIIVILFVIYWIRKRRSKSYI